MAKSDYKFPRLPNRKLTVLADERSWRAYMKLFMTKKFQGQQSHPKPKTLATRGAEQKEFTLLAKNLRPL